MNFSLGRFLNKWDTSDDDSPLGRYNREQDAINDELYGDLPFRPFNPGRRMELRREQRDWRVKAHPFRSMVIDLTWKGKFFTENYLDPRQVWRNMKHVTQRARRGWSDQDAWNAYTYWNDIIPGMIEKLSEWRTGTPMRSMSDVKSHPDGEGEDDFGAYTTEEWWDGIVEDMLRCLRRGAQVQENPGIWLELSREEREWVDAEWRRGMALLMEHWGTFWD